MKIRWRFDWVFAFIFLVWFALAYLICSVFGLCLQSLTAVGTWFLALGVIFAWWQVRQLKRSTDARLALGLIEELRSAQMLTVIRYVYSLEPEKIKNLSAVDKNNIDNVIDKLDMLSVFAIHRLISRTLVIEAYGNPTILKSWFQLYDYISDFRSKRKDKWCRYFEEFALITYRHLAKELESDCEWPKFYRPYKGRLGDLINLKDALKPNGGNLVANYNVQPIEDSGC